MKSSQNSARHGKSRRHAAKVAVVSGCAVCAFAFATPAQADGFTVSTPDGTGAQLLTGPSTNAVMSGNRLNENAAVSIMC